MRKQDMKEDGSGAVNRKPWSIKETAIYISPFHQVEQEYFPKKARSGTDKEEKNLQRDNICNIVLLRWAEFVKIR